MRLYKITTTDTSKTGIRKNETHWVGSKSEGVAVRKQLAEEGWVRKEITEVEVDVPTDKTGLIKYLNMVSAA
jgi:hypothetical protein